MRPHGRVIAPPIPGVERGGYFQLFGRRPVADRHEHRQRSGSMSRRAATGAMTAGSTARHEPPGAVWLPLDSDKRREAPAGSAMNVDWVLPQQPICST